MSSTAKVTVKKGCMHIMYYFEFTSYVGTCVLRGY